MTPRAALLTAIHEGIMVLTGHDSGHYPVGPLRDLPRKAAGVLVL